MRICRGVVRSKIFWKDSASGDGVESALSLYPRAARPMTSSVVLAMISVTAVRVRRL